MTRQRGVGMRRLEVPETYRSITVASGMRLAAQRTPQRVAIATESRRLTCRELGERIDRVAALAAGRWGLRHGDRAAVLAPNCLEYVELVCGLAEAGVIVATLNARTHAREVTQTLNDCGARAIVVHPSLAAFVEPSTVPSLEHVLVLGDDYDAWLASADPDVTLPRVEETDTFGLVYTSGTTGRPKGVMLSHRSRAWLFLASAAEYGCFGPEHRHLAVAPMAHGGGFAFPAGNLFLGGAVELLGKFEPELVLRRLADGDHTSVFLVPTHFQAILDLPAATLERWRGTARALRTIISNAAALPQSLKERIVGYFGPGLLHETYGCTEGGIITNLRPPDQLRKLQCVGPPFLGNRVRLLSPEGAPVGVGEIGELHSSSPLLFNGYWNQPEETAAALRDGWLTVGDLARIDDEGYLYIVGRRKDMIISGGINIYPREIEEVLQAHPCVLEAAVVGLPDAKWGERLHARVVLAAGQHATAADLIEHCRAQLPAFKVPRDVTFADALPRNASGKIVKNALRQELAGACT